MTLTLAEGRPMTSSADIITGRCAVWALPHTSACAEAAREIVRAALKTLLLPSQLTDCVVVVSELATNAFLHGLAGRSREDRYAPDAGRSEVAIYRRGPENAAELVITVFDPRPDLNAVVKTRPNPLAGLPDKDLHESLSAEVLDELLRELPDAPLPESASPEAVYSLPLQHWSGQRGLDTVRMLAGGRHGFYRTTSRLGARPVSGKVAWVAIPLAAGSLAARPPQTAYRPAEAVKVLRAELGARGIDHMIQNDLPDRSVLSLRHSTVWCDARAYSWHGGAGNVRHPHADLVEAVEQLIRINEDREYSPLRTSL